MFNFQFKVEQFKEVYFQFKVVLVKEISMRNLGTAYLVSCFLVSQKLAEVTQGRKR